MRIILDLVGASTVGVLIAWFIEDAFGASFFWQGFVGYVSGVLAYLVFATFGRPR